jgi:hypothetical protein
MAQDEDGLGAENGHATFETGDELQRRDVASNACHEQPPEALVENQLNRHAGIGAGQYHSSWPPPPGTSSRACPGQPRLFLVGEDVDARHKPGVTRAHRAAAAKV